MSEQNDELPHGWTRVQLGDVLEFKYGKSLPAKLREGYCYPVFGSNGIVGKHSEALVEGPVLIIGRKGSIGAIHQSDGPCWPIDTTYFVNDFGGQPIRFWYHRLKALPLAELDRATALPGLNRQDAYDLEITLPPLAEQLRIVAKIEALQERSRRTQEALLEVGPLLEQFRQSVLAAAFRGDLTADWRAAHPDVEPASVLLERSRAKRRHRWEQAELAKYEAKDQKPPKNWQEKYREPEPIDDSDLPELPTGWTWIRVAELASDLPRAIQSGPFGSNLLHSEFQDTGILAIGIDNVHRDGFSLGQQHRISREKYEELKKYTARPLDVLVTVMATVGRCCLVPTDLETAIITKHVYRITLDQRLINPQSLGV